VLAVAIDADAKHVVDGLSQPVERGARQRSAVVHVVVDPEAFYVVKAYLLGSLYSVHEPDILSECVGVSHGAFFFAKILFFFYMFHVLKQDME